MSRAGPGWSAEGSRHPDVSPPPTGGFRSPPLGRPAALYSRGRDRLLYPPILRSGEVARQQIAERPGPAATSSGDFSTPPINE